MHTAPSTHPFAMYDAIHSQPMEALRVGSVPNDTVEDLAQAIGGCKQTILVGIGSSLHAAQIGAAVWREVLPHLPVRAIHSFDFVTDPTSHGEINNDSCVIALSHRGTKAFTLQALAQARESKAPTCVVTGMAQTTAAQHADMHLSTVPQERSSAHTVSLTGSIATLCLVIEKLAGVSDRRLSDNIVTTIEQAIAQEDTIRNLAARVGPLTRHIWLVGAGADVVVARETALKIKETSYIPAEGMSVEEMLHGPFQCAEPEDLFILLDTQGIASERLATLHKMAQTVGASILVVSSQSTAAGDQANDGLYLQPGAQKAINAVGALVALQLFTYFVAVNRGKNPDSFRLEDPRFKQAASLVRL